MRRRWLGAAVAVAAVSIGLLLLVSVPRVAQAVPNCGGVNDSCNCGMANFCICCTDAYYGTDHGNCVWYAWHRACCAWGVGLPWCTNAEVWDTGATNNGYTLLTTPCEDTIFVCEINTSHCNSGGYGHVGWINAVYPNGSIDVEEQGCYSWYGVVSRNFNAAAASPTMHYIYGPGVTSCSQCECSPGDVDTNGCGNCGTETRTCGGDCQWGGWSGCQNEGACADGATQGCGSCGGTQQCGSNCEWGVCVETCPDGSVPQSDGQVVVPPDGTTPTTDSGVTPQPDGSTPGSDSGSSTRPGMVSGGCGCQSGQGHTPADVALILALCLLFVFRRRR